VSQHVTFLLLGLANGAVFAALGLALVVTHRSSKVMNFGVSSIALLTACLYAGLRRGELLLLVPGLPRSVRLADSLPFGTAAVLALVVTALFGLLLYALVFRPLRSEPPVASAVASLGVAVVVAAVITQRLGTRPPPVATMFPEGKLQLGDVTVAEDKLWLAVSVVAIAVGIWALGRFTRFGLASRAVSQSEKGAHLSGIPADRIAAANWMLSALVAGVAGILIAPFVPPVPIQYTLFIVPALATATLGGFDRLAPAVVGGLAVGMLQSEVAYLQVQHSWMPRSGAAELVPLALILLVLVARAKPLPGRGVLQSRNLGRAPRPRSVLAPATVGAVCGGVALAVLGAEWRAALVTSLILGLITLSYVVVTGYSGQISLAQLTLAGAAGFLLGPITTEWELPLVHAHLPFPLAPVAAALGAAVIGVVIGLPAVRIRGLPVAVVTLALAVALEAAWFRNTDLVTSSGKDVAGPTLLGLDLRIGSGLAYPRLGFCLMALLVLVVAGAGVARLRTSSLGAAMLAVRANERAAAAAGVDVVRTKVVAFALGAFIAGLGGALLAYKQGNVTVESFSAFLGLSVFATAYLAGITSVSGAVVAGLIGANGIVFTAVDDHLSLGRWYTTLAGVGLVFTVVKNPEGIVGPAHDLLATHRLRSTPPLPADAAAGPATAGVHSVPPPAPPPGTVAAGVGVGVGRGSGRMVGGEAVLSVRDLVVRYGGVVAVDRVGFDVARGTIVGLIGPNGAGKTTLLDAVSGFAPASGEIVVDGRRIDGMKPHRRVRVGLGRTFQSIELYDDLSVAENVVVGQTAARGRGDGDPRGHLARTLEVLGLAPLRDRPAGELSQGTRQLVSIARALVGRPAILLLDEPAAGLDSTESRWLGERLRGIRDSGTTILLVDHDVPLVLDLCDEIHVLDFGTVIASGPPSIVREDARVAAAYLGGAGAAAEVASGSRP
jgi:ABC-type branched-subunit amino acid transport system ATPase component/branched-subunit amino acid ABC-type transport system permease component